MFKKPLQNKAFLHFLKLPRNITGVTKGALEESLTTLLDVDGFESEGITKGALEESLTFLVVSAGFLINDNKPLSKIFFIVCPALYIVDSTLDEPVARLIIFIPGYFLYFLFIIFLSRGYERVKFLLFAVVQLL